ncbi:uncharacterized protein SCODWIG_00572 [Saccharomycodes ludwigii]|uniref:TECPR1-like DysF domain-containing protein n=1 Tax=Saccharomycodes ludwigii TaxID=36035 RepID=A0A376B2D7_9ASCO|nr:uncharacterized protein SCODWIG_00572 [Saccharomycodes ludwigii]
MNTFNEKTTQTKRLIGVLNSLLNSAIESTQIIFSNKEDENINSNNKEDTINQHFSDVFFEKILKNVLKNYDETLTSPLSKRIKNKRQQQDLSLKILASDLSFLTSKLSNWFEFQNSLTNLFIWKNPSKTIIFLFVLTAICFHPILILLIPLMYYNIDILIPRYCSIKDHNDSFKSTILDNDVKDIILKSVDSQNTSNSVTLLQGELYQENTFFDKLFKYSTADRGIDNINHKMPADNNRKGVGKEKEEKEQQQQQQQQQTQDPTIFEDNVQQSMEFIINLRDLQSLLNVMVKMIVKTENFLYKNESLLNDRYFAIVISQTILIVCLLFWFFSKYINWHYFFAILFWWILLKNHPYILECRKKREESNNSLNLGNKKSDKKNSNSIFRRWANFYRGLNPITREKLEIYEVQYKDVNGEWSLYKYCKLPFNPYLTKNENIAQIFKSANEDEIGSTNLNLVIPPNGWIFEPQSSWEADLDRFAWNIRWQ